MKKLYLLLPVLGWIAIYFIWSYSAPYANGPATFQGVWWALTDIFVGFGEIGLVFYTISKL